MDVSCDEGGGRERGRRGENFVNFGNVRVSSSSGVIVLKGRKFEKKKKEGKRF